MNSGEKLTLGVFCLFFLFMASTGIANRYTIFDGPRQVFQDVDAFRDWRRMQMRWREDCFTAAYLDAGSFAVDVSDKVADSDGTCANETVDSYYLGRRDEYLILHQAKIWEELNSYWSWESPILEADFKHMIAAAGGSEYAEAHCVWIVDWAIWGDYAISGSGPSENVAGIRCDDETEHLLTY